MANLKTYNVEVWIRMKIHDVTIEAESKKKAEIAVERSTLVDLNMITIDVGGNHGHQHREVQFGTPRAVAIDDETATRKRQLAHWRKMQRGESC